MNLIIGKFIEILSLAPEPVLSSGSMGVKRPSTASDVPAVVMSLNLEKLTGSGIGRFIRSGDTVVKNTAVIEDIEK